ncbi:hypothetical protein BD311DRAFT_312589 [Dichomitus squalens]|uniref:Uncharacterized protein n=1 Tax=Dichomitus squalens TaxID=114155 RepID=A0A4Q9MQZ1_9APHY|nr:hypothetical protein BD311DRAFT_312589 [Dichomitus squalens]
MESVMRSMVCIVAVACLYSHFVCGTTAVRRRWPGVDGPDVASVHRRRAHLLWVIGTINLVQRGEVFRGVKHHPNRDLGSVSGCPGAVCASLCLQQSSVFANM